MSSADDAYPADMRAGSPDYIILLRRFAGVCGCKGFAARPIQASSSLRALSSRNTGRRAKISLAATGDDARKAAAPVCAAAIGTPPARRFAQDGGS